MIEATTSQLIDSVSTQHLFYLYTTFIHLSLLIVFVVIL